MYEQNNGFLNTPQGNHTINNYYYGKVIDTNDQSDTKRIKVRILGVDDKVDDDNLPWCTSFLPLNICMTPKEGEMVKVFFQNSSEINNKREWLGPVISNYKKLGYDSYNNALNNSQLSNKTLPSKILKDIYNIDTFSLYGRDNSDISFKPNELLLRAGGFSVDDRNKLNEKNAPTIRLKLNPDGESSNITAFSDNILLISNNGRFQFNKTITDREVTNIIENAYSATYAEPLIEFMKLVQDFVVNHIHANNLPPNSGTGSVMSISNFDVESVKSKGIKIN